MSWLQGERSELAADRILDAAGAVFAEHGPDGVGMDQIAQAAGCSRATLYRYFENSRSLQDSFAEREAIRVLDEVRAAAAEQGWGASDGAEVVLLTLRAVRSRPYLRAWYAGGDVRVLHDIVRGSVVIEALGAADPDLAHWVLRTVLSFLAVPGVDEDEERRLVERFLGEAVGGRT